jgi:hypothetical protein
MEHREFLALLTTPAFARPHLRERKARSPLRVNTSLGFLRSSLATSSEKLLQKVHCLTPSPRLFQVFSHWLKNGLG